ncbi:hypothetical protein A3K86_21585 [Photobacterium jeanii]|uniref:DUF6916 domain-containing protein n=1 Tax=Photobacterium jeanii TaxID=858640 RepID=A0A178K4B0_9GAMM|nr:hypothetical protein [Photobacterium jeanii]OAN11523.1 hypothetical protein A3K86_21585 [Photobacterium jeanii]PST91041.1 hypothetical protein C9I91_10690 [Photobacterium jeanii]
MNPLSMKNVEKLIGESVDLFDASGTTGRFIVQGVQQLERHGMDDYGRFVEHFKILFAGDGSSHFPDGHYHFKHPKLGEIELFLTHTHGHEYEIMVDSQVIC